MRTKAIGFASLALAAVVLAVATLTAKQPTPRRWEYLVLSPGLRGNLDTTQHGYEACEAKNAEWTCRPFRSLPTEFGDDALRRALATIGAEGWELVSVLEQPQNQGYPVGRTYLLKRPGS